MDFKYFIMISLITLIISILLNLKINLLTPPSLNQMICLILMKNSSNFIFHIDFYIVQLIKNHSNLVFINIISSYFIYCYYFFS